MEINTLTSGILKMRTEDDIIPTVEHPYYRVSGKGVAVIRDDKDAAIAEWKEKTNSL